MTRAWASPHKVSGSSVGLNTLNKLDRLNFHKQGKSSDKDGFDMSTSGFFMTSLAHAVIVVLCTFKYLMEFKLFLHILFLLHLLSSLLLWMLMIKSILGLFWP